MRTCQVLSEGCRDGVAPGFVAGVWQKKDPEQFWVEAFGNRRVEPSILPMLPETIFDLASVTKVFATTALTAQLVQRGWLDWDTRVASILPEYPYPEVKVRHLLSHTAGYPAWQPFWEKIRERAAPDSVVKYSIQDRQKWMRELVFAVAPEVSPGKQVLYSDLSFLILGFLLEELTQMPLDESVRNWVWNPMGISGAYYRRVTRSAHESIDEKVAATEACPWRRAVLQGQVHDDNCWAMGGYGGHAGAFGTAEDLLRFSKALVEGFFRHDILQAMWTRVQEPAGCSRTLGWDTPSGDSPSVGRYFSVSSVGHLGFTGTSLWIDPKAGLVVTLLSNRVHPSRENIKIRAFRSRFHEAVWLDLYSSLPESIPADFF